MPTHKELQISLSWLIRNEFLIKRGKKYLLSEQGKSIIEVDEKKSSIISEIWKILAEDLPLPR